MKSELLRTLFILPFIFVIGGMTIVKAEQGDLLLTIPPPLFYDARGFGHAIATTHDGDIVVGLERNDVNGAENAGSVAIINSDTGELLRIIDNPDPKQEDLFGLNVKVMPNGKLVVAQRAREGDPKFHIFDVTSGQLLLSIGYDIVSNGPDIIAGTQDGNFLIGSPNAAGGGAVFLYDGNNGQLLLKINNPFPEAYDGFGFAVGAGGDGNFLINTKFSYDDRVGNQVYLYDGKSGELLQSIQSQNNSGYFWGAIITGTTDGDFVIPQIKRNPYTAVIYIIDGLTGEVLQTIENPQPTPFNDTFFAADIVITSAGNLLVSTDTNSTTSPLAHLFDGLAGELLLTIKNPNDEISQRYPQVATTGGKLIVSVPFDSTPNSPNDDYYGEIYVFEGLSQSCSLVGSTLDDISCMINRLQRISDANQGTPLEVRINDAIVDLGTSIDKFNKIPPNYKSALRFLRLAVKDIDAAVAEGLLELNEGTRLMDSMASIAKKVAQDANDRASDRGGDPNKTKGATQLILIGDQRRTVGRYINALWQYRKATIMAEGA